MENKIAKTAPRRRRRLWAAGAAAGCLLGLTAATGDSFEVVKNLDIFYTVVEELEACYVDEIDHGKTVKTAIDKMLASLDPYTNYIPESKIEDLRFMTTGNYGGVGALIRKSGSRAIIADPYEGKPAQKAGMRAGDLLVRVDGADTEGLDIEAISEKLKGTPGSTVRIEAERPGVEGRMTFEVRREKIHISAIPYYTMADSATGYIQFNNFTYRCSDELREAMDSLSLRGARRMVIDMRGNPGGLLEEAVAICNLFVPKGQLVVSTKGKMKQWNRDYVTTTEPHAPRMPVAVLVDRGSASASEIVAGTLQDLDRGVVVGARTYGKGLVQATRPLSYNAQLKLTTAKYYIPSGRCIQALDYTHRNDDGSVGAIPDSLISDFRTRNGRLVRDGGGVAPDIEAQKAEMSLLATELYLENLIFDFATLYANRHATIAPAGEFAVGDADFDQFADFVAERGFEHKPESAELLNELAEALKEEKAWERVEGQVEAMRQALKRDLRADIYTFKDEIARLLTQEIASRYYYHAGRAQAFLRHDAALDTALAVLADTARYRALLAGPGK